MMKLYCFDFDGTLTTNDTLLEFIKYAKGFHGLLGGFILYSPLLVAMKLHMYPNGKVKQKIFSFYFKGMEIERFDELCRNFASDNRHLLRPKGIETVRKARKEGAEIMVVSASIDNWVSPFFEEEIEEGSLIVLGTKVEVSNNRLTGFFLTDNCYGQEKVNRIKKHLSEPRENYEIVAFGDSRGDKEMIAYADKGYYKPFR